MHFTLIILLQFFLSHLFSPLLSPILLSPHLMSHVIFILLFLYLLSCTLLRSNPPCSNLFHPSLSSLHSLPCSFLTSSSISILLLHSPLLSHSFHLIYSALIHPTLLSSTLLSSPLIVSHLRCCVRL